MRSNTLLLFVLAAVSSTAIAAPIRIGSFGPLQNIPTGPGRHYVGMLPPLHNPDGTLLGSKRAEEDAESGAFSLSDAAHAVETVGPHIWNGVKQLIDEHEAKKQQQTRDDSKLSSFFSSVHPHWNGVGLPLPDTRSAMESRDASDVESGAFSWSDAAHYAETLAPHVWNGVKQLIDEHNANKQQPQSRDEDSGAITLPEWRHQMGITMHASPQIIQARELVDVLARQVADDVSGAFGLSDAAHYAETLAPHIWNGVKQLIDEHTANKQQAQTRDFFMARDDSTDESGAFGLSDVVHVAKTMAPHIWNGVKQLVDEHNANKPQTRDEMSAMLFARADAIDLESGAFSLSDVGHVVTTLAPHVWTGVKQLIDEHNANKQQTTRDVGDSESDAINIGGILGDIGRGILGIFGGGSNNQKQSRELVALLARAALEEY